MQLLKILSTQRRNNCFINNILFLFVFTAVKIKQKILYNGHYDK